MNQLGKGKLHTLHTQNRRVDYWVPDESSGPCPVLVMHDGQNLFNPENSFGGKSWRVAEALSDMTEFAGRLPVVIGPWNSGVSRAAEYAPQDVIEEFEEPYEFVGTQTETPLLGNAYQLELIEEVIPAVANLVELRKDRKAIAIGGSSMGGLASLYAIAKYPDKYGTAISVSTHFPMSTLKFVEELMAMLPDPETGHRLWLDHGTTELDATYAKHHDTAISKLHMLGYKHPQLESHIYPGTGHNEGDWSLRIKSILQWWLATATKEGN
jgi:predicted alpha/beta superfamily hydrolase